MSSSQRATGRAVGAATPGTGTTPTPTAAGANRGQHPIHVLLVDDHAVLRQALQMLLQAQPEIEVVGGGSRTAARPFALPRS